MVFEKQVHEYVLINSVKIGLAGPHLLVVDDFIGKVILT